VFDQFWEFDMLVKDEVPGKAEITGSRPLLWDFWVLGLCKRYGMLAHGFTHA